MKKIRRLESLGAVHTHTHTDSLIKNNKNKGITLVALIVTIIILLLLAGIAIETLGGENGIFAKVKQAKKAQLEAEMKEQLTMALQELQIAKQGNATLDDVTQDWANKAILKDYSPLLQEDASLNGKLIIMTKNKIKGKFLIDQNLNIEKIEYNTSSLEFEYTTVSRVDNKVKINIIATDRINGIKQIEYPKGNPLKVVDGKETQISIDYEVELGKEYKFIITTGDGNETEKIIKIDDYFYNVTIDLEKRFTIDNNATKAAYNKPYEATISSAKDYVLTNLTVTMGGQRITTDENNIVDINIGKIKIAKVTGDIDIKASAVGIIASSYTEGYSPECAFDGNSSTNWLPAPNAVTKETWIEHIYESEIEPTKFNLSSYTVGQNYIVKIQGYINSEWVDLTDEFAISQSGSISVNCKVIDAKTDRIKIIFTDGTELAHLQGYYGAHIISVTYSEEPMVIYSDAINYYSNQYLPSNAFDGNGATRWAAESGTPAEGGWISWQYNKNIQPKSFTITSLIYGTYVATIQAYTNNEWIDITDEYTFSGYNSQNTNEMIQCNKTVNTNQFRVYFKNKNSNEYLHLQGVYSIQFAMIAAQI